MDNPESARRGTPDGASREEAGKGSGAATENGGYAGRVWKGIRMVEGRRKDSKERQEKERGRGRGPPSGFARSLVPQASDGASSKEGGRCVRPSSGERDERRLGALGHSDKVVQTQELLGGGRKEHREKALVSAERDNSNSLARDPETLRALRFYSESAFIVS